jgi:hypothetical protein
MGSGLNSQKLRKSVPTLSNAVLRWGITYNLNFVNASFLIHTDTDLSFA